MPDSATASGRTRPWPTWLALAAVWVLALADQQWVFPILFLAWAAYDVWSGESNFVQRLPRRTQPVTFWLVVSSWVGLSVLWLAYPT